MANGCNYSEEEFKRLEAPLLEMDKCLEEFAKKNKIKLSRNAKGCPERSLNWGRKIKKLIQIYCVNPEKLEFNFWICAHQDRGLKRYWKNKFLKENSPASGIVENLTTLLNDGYNILESWQENDLEFGTKIEDIKKVAERFGKIIRKI